MPTRPLPVHVRIELDLEVLSRVVRELGLREPPSFVLNDNGFTTSSSIGATKYRGLYEPGRNIVRIASQSGNLQRERLIEATRHVKFTVLHELRHAWQRENWDADFLAEAGKGAYEDRIEEKDANAWAAYAAPMFPGLVKITRRPVGGRSGFAKLSDRTNR